MVVFSSVSTVAEDWCNWFCKQEVIQWQKTHGSHEQKRWRFWRACFLVKKMHLHQKLIENVSLWAQKWCYCQSHFLILETSVFIYLYFGNHAANFVEICFICADQIVIKVAISINSDKLSHSYDDNLYLSITFFGTQGIVMFLCGFNVNYVKHICSVIWCDLQCNVILILSWNTSRVR